MNNSKIWLSSPHMGGNERKFVNEAFEENWIAPLGPNVTGFEKDLENYLHNSDVSISTKRSVAALSSGTAAIHLALVLLNVGKDDEVICQSLTFAASANPIKYMGATPVFVDSESDTLNISPVYLEEAIRDRLAKGKNLKAIIAVHLYGMPYKAEEIHAVADKYNIPVIEDSAEALGSSYAGQKCGTFGDYSVLSFNGNKIITTSGGGALVLREEEQKKKTVFLATQARDNAPHYQHSEIGYNYRLSNVSAGIGRGQMEVLDEHVKRRREMNRFYKELFLDVPGVKVMTEPDDRFFSNHWLSIILVDRNRSGYFTANKLRLSLEKENIESRPLWKPMHLQPVFANAPFYGKGISEEAFENGLCLPSGSNLGKAEKERIAGAINIFLEKQLQ